jgi:hypothetical protein
MEVVEGRPAATMVMNICSVPHELLLFGVQLESIFNSSAWAATLRDRAAAIANQPRIIAILFIVSPPFVG